jgi:hypothetical protein
VTPEVLYCAKKAGVTHLLKAGGAQAVAAMGWGTQTCPKVDKIFGPGNQFVTAAKMLLTNSEAMVAIDMPAGPSEVLVIAGEHIIGGPDYGGIFGVPSPMCCLWLLGHAALQKMISKAWPICKHIACVVSRLRMCTLVQTFGLECAAPTEIVCCVD